jgi:hypothetical protein
LKTLKAALEGLIHKREDEAEPLLYDVLRRAIGTVPPYSVFQTTNAYKQWHRHAAYAEGFIAKNFPEATKLQRQALMTLTVKALVTDLKGRNVPITMGSVVKNLGRFAAIFDLEFPSYIESGMQFLILKALTEK